MILTDEVGFGDSGIGAPAPAAALVSHVLLLERDIGEVRSLQLALAQAGWADVLLWHEPSLGRAMTLLALCEFRLILLGPGLSELALHAAQGAIGRVAPETPVVVMRDGAAESGSVELLSTVRALLDDRPRSRCL